MAVLILFNQHGLGYPSLPQAGHSLPKLEEMVDRLAGSAGSPRGWRRLIIRAAVSSTSSINASAGLAPSPV